MRDIKFRGLEKKTKMFVFGWLIGEEKNRYIRDEYTSILVDPETVGQFTGLKDKNKKRIYEGDIAVTDTDVIYDELKLKYAYTGEVMIIASRGVCIKNPMCYDYLSGETYRLKMYKPISAYRTKIIGNIHQNPEILL